MDALRLPFAALLAVLLVAGCAEEEPAAPPAAEAPRLSASRPDAVQAVRPPVEPRREALEDTCALVPTAAVQSALGGRALPRDATHEASRQESIAGACVVAPPDPEAPGLRVELFTPESWHGELPLERWWSDETGSGSRDVTRKVGAPAFWVARTGPQRRALLVQGDRGIYQFTSVDAGGRPLRSTMIENVASAVLSQE